MIAFAFLFADRNMKAFNREWLTVLGCLVCLIATAGSGSGQQSAFGITEDDQQFRLVTPQLEAAIRKTGYVSGVAGGSMLDKRTGFRDAGFGLDIVDWIMEPGSDKEYRDQLNDELVYRFGNPYHGKRPKRMIEGPQICTQAKRVSPTVIRGDDFVAFKMSFQYQTAAPDKTTGSIWSQTLVFPKGKRYFVSSDRIEAVNSSEAMFLRIDMPGHIKHRGGDTFSHVYLSYLPQTDPPAGFDGNIIPAASFEKNFAPDEFFNYRRPRLEDNGLQLPQRFIRAYRLRDPDTGKQGPWLAGMTLDASVVHEAWCHQRGYVCMIQEFGGRPVKAGESFSAAFIIGFFDSIEEMHAVYDAHQGHTGLEADEGSWQLTKLN